MKKILCTLLFLLPFCVNASSGIELDSPDIDLSDTASLERGAKHYVTYCLGCHSAKHIRYKRIAMDLKLDESEILKNVAPLGAGIYDQMHSAMNAHDAEKWFGTTPPDLSLIARSRGADWLYTYLRSFYNDKNKPLGVNNSVFPDVGMPNVFWQLQGTQTAVVHKVDGRDVITELKLEQPGQLSPKEFDKMVTDLVNFLVYVGEPVQLERQQMGKFVLFFLLMFIALAYLLKKEYWKDVH
ncbi:cytochrome c1 [Methylomonas sp. MED-D]|uniref:Cytochrome C n=1 Tax=Methylomonas koyamae TaxID=702114 RepID=A0A177N716_9GAMM|nr:MULTISPECIES: cytochrome c1 [Methylomonas]MDT4330383.1 cytochrome c1 [Methylomonas sp. MV1]NJA08272.1 cytochrome c1 [Methylococcaceae bacterium WWC4]OAI13384.1 cytochrome C [Methylomonas koyamae]